MASPQPRVLTSPPTADLHAVISCIVPVFNGECYLAETLDSILQQTHSSLEIIVADDGSTDGTAAIVAGYGERVTYLWQPNAGETAARNLGLRAARGHFVAFLDADDLWHPDKLARQVTRFQDRPDLDLCFTRFENFWSPECTAEAEYYRKRAFSPASSAYSICTVLARRAAFQKFGHFVDDGRRGPQNLIWLFHAAEHGARIEMLPDLLMYRRLHRENLSRKRSTAHDLDTFFPILKAWRDYQRRVREETTASARRDGVAAPFGAGLPMTETRPGGVAC
jgi:glycosyltransferase involved in cell wall biosynthesis